MNLARALTQVVPSVRWRPGKAVTHLLYRRAFKAIGADTVIFKPLVLRGAEHISLGSDYAIYEGCWLGAEPGGTLTVGDGVYLGHDVHLHAIDDVAIGRGTMIEDGAMVNSGKHVRDQAMLVEGTGSIEIGDGCFIGQRA